MAKRGGRRTQSLDALIRRLRALERERSQLILEIKTSTDKLLMTLGTPPPAPTAYLAERQQPRVRKGGRPKGFKTSAATKAKLRAAWKRRKAAAAQGR